MMFRLFPALLDSRRIRFVPTSATTFQGPPPCTVQPAGGIPPKEECRLRDGHRVFARTRRCSNRRRVLYAHERAIARLKQKIGLH